MYSKPQNTGHNKPPQELQYPFSQGQENSFPQGRIINKVFIQEHSYQRDDQKNLQKVERREKFYGKKCVYVSNIDGNVTEDVLKKNFEQFGGTIKDLNYRRDTLRRPKGYAFIKFGNATVSRRVLKYMNNKFIEGRNIKVLEIKKPKKENAEGNIVIKNYHSVDEKELQRFFSQYDETCSLKFSPEKKKAYIQLGTMKASDILEKLEKFEMNSVDGKKKIFERIDKDKPEIYALEKTKSLFIRNLPYEDLNEKEFINFLEGEGRKRKIIKFTFGKQDKLRKSWGVFKFDTYESANQVFETLKSHEWKNQRLEVFWRTKKISKSKMREIEKMFMFPLKPTVTGEILTNFFKTNISPKLRLSVKVWPPNPNNETLATVFVHKEDQNKLHEFIIEQKDKNMALLRTIYQTDEKSKIIYRYLIPETIKEEYFKMKTKFRADFPITPITEPVVKTTTLEYNSNSVQNPPVCKDEYQRLGQLLYPLIYVKVDNNEDLAKKITEMLIDKTVFEIEEVKEFVENPLVLQERVLEALDLIKSFGDN